MPATRANVVPRPRSHLLTAGRVVAGLCAMAAGVAVAASPAAAAAASLPAVPSASASATHAGTLTAMGVCPFDYEYDTFGQSWPDATYSGKLTGFAPKTTYYVYIDNNIPSDYSPAPVTSNAQGTIRLGHTELAIPGPDQLGQYPISVKTIPISISTENKPYDQSPPAGQVYRPKTTLVVNPTCNPWTAEGGATIVGDGTSQMTSTNKVYFFGENPDVQTGAFELTHGASSTVVWSTNTKGSNNNIVMQKDGNLVVYGNGKALWQSHTYNHPGAHLVLQKDRNLVIYSAAGKALWQSGTYVR